MPRHTDTAYAKSDQSIPRHRYTCESSHREVEPSQYDKKPADQLTLAPNTWLAYVQHHDTGASSYEEVHGCDLPLRVTKRHPKTLEEMVTGIMGGAALFSTAYRAQDSPTSSGNVHLYYLRFAVF